jgi:hypothetical protein
MRRDPGVFLGNGDATVQARIDSPAGRTGPAQLAVGRLDENAMLDLVVANDGSNTTGHRDPPRRCQYRQPVHDAA